jgi:hypothetical protein
MDLLKPKRQTMRKFLFIAVAGAATLILIRSPSAQNVDTAAAAKAAMEQAVTQMGIQPQPSTAAQNKADAAMMTPPDSRPTSEADQRAAAAMSKTP